jgi:hypothetical protein
MVCDQSMREKAWLLSRMHILCGGTILDVPVVMSQIVGVIMFSEPITLKLASFIGLALAGGILYTYIKEKEMQEMRKHASPLAVSKV